MKSFVRWHGHALLYESERGRKQLPAPAPRIEHMALRVSGLCFLVLFLEGYDVSAMGYAMPSLIEAWHASAPQFTATVTLGAVSMLVGSLCAGVLGDRLGRKPVLIGCVAIFGTFSLLIAWCTGLGSLTVMRFLACLGLGGGVPLTIALATDYAPMRNPRRLVILMSTGLAVGSTAGGLIARQFVTSFGWEAIFIFGGLLPMLLVPLLVVFLPESHALRAEPVSARRASPLELFRHGLALQTVVLWIIDFCNMVCAFLILVWLPAILHRQGLSLADAIFASTMYAFGAIGGGVIMAPIADRLGVERVVACVLCLGAGCMLLFGTLALPYAELCVVIGSVGIGIGGGQHGINAVSGAIYPAAIRATGAGWALGIGRAGQVVGPLGGGLLLGLGWQPQDIFLAASGPAICVAFGMATLAYLRSCEDRNATAMAPRSASAMQSDISSLRHRR
jgi:AAHS family 4-hydroxybenzoate transporter-like MFS transporter